MSLLLNKQNTDTPRNPTQLTLKPHQKPLPPTYKPIQSQRQRSLFPSLTSPTAKYNCSNQPRAEGRLTQIIEDLIDRITDALEIITSCTVPHLLTKLPTQTNQQQLDPQQTLHRHQKHTKHRHLQCPSLPKPHLYLSKCLPSPVTILPPTYYRYLAHNFQPP